MLEEIKEFLNQNGLNWTGNISKSSNINFRKAAEEDFKTLEIADFLISFESDGYMAIAVELDLANFRILGETFDYAVDVYAGNNVYNKSLCEEKDLSQEWINFQLKKNGLLYFTDDFFSEKQGIYR